MWRPFATSGHGLISPVVPVSTPMSATVPPVDGRIERPRKRPRAADLEDQVDPPAAGEVQHRPVPVLRRAVVHDGVGAQLQGPLGLVVGTGREDHPGAGGAGELEPEDRHATGAEHEHGAARLRGDGLEQRVPGGERGAGQRRRLLEGEAVGEAHEARRPVAPPARPASRRRCRRAPHGGTRTRKGPSRHPGKKFAETRSPTAQPSTPSPTSTISPAPSDSGMVGRLEPRPAMTRSR